MKIKETLTTQQKIDLFEGQTVGIFSFLINENDKFFSSRDSLCLGYYMNHSGEKTISPTYEKIIEFSKEENLPSSPEEIIAKIIRSKFIEKWEKIFSALIESNYNPISTEQYSEIKNGNNTDNTTYNIETTDNGKNSIKQKETTTNSRNDTVYGFNSSTGVNDTSTNGNITTEIEANLNDNLTENINKKTGTKNRNFGVDETLSIEGRHKTSASELINEEILLRNEQIFFDIIYSDIDSITTISIYI